MIHPEDELYAKVPGMNKMSAEDQERLLRAHKRGERYVRADSQAPRLKEVVKYDRSNRPIHEFVDTRPGGSGSCFREWAGTFMQPDNLILQQVRIDTAPRMDMSYGPGGKRA